MIKLGEMQKLEVVKKMDFGFYLKSADDEKGENRILLPIKQVPENTEIGDKIEVFVYRDSNDRIIATTNKPKITIGQIGYLKVVELSRIGAFLNWGLEKDLFLPFKEQIGELRNNGEYMVGLYVDKSDRLCATMNLFKVLTTDSPYKINDIVKGTVFSLKRGLGAMVAVDGKYLGLIHEGEILKPLRAGDEVELRISNIKEDGKLDLSLKDAPKLQIDRDGDRIFNALAKNKGTLPLNDNSKPELINEMLGMSKGSFKKGVGRLMKRGIIEITKEGIKLSDKKVNPVREQPNQYDHSNRNDRNDRNDRNNRDNKDNRQFNKDNKDNRPFNRDNKDNRPFNKDNKDSRPFNKDNKDSRSFNKDNKDNRPFNRDNKDNRQFNKDNNKKSFTNDDNKKNFKNDKNHKSNLKDKRK